MSKPVLLVFLILIVVSIFFVSRRTAVAGEKVDKKADEMVDEDTLARLKADIYAGNQTWSEIQEACQDMAKDMLYQDIISEDQVASQAAAIETIAKRFWDGKLKEEKGWPEVTDFERLDQVFDKLTELGLVCLHNAGYTTSDGHQDVFEYTQDHPQSKFRGYCFYHGQDTERALQDGVLYLAFGSLPDDEAVQQLKIANLIARELKVAGFEPIWDGTVKQRISFKLDYKRRSPRD